MLVSLLLVDQAPLDLRTRSGRRPYGRVPWPALLRRPAYNRDRERIDQLVGDLGKQAAGGALDSGSLDTGMETTNSERQ